MNKTMMEILACPIDKNHPLELFEINQKENVVIEGAIFCPKCSRFYPICLLYTSPSPRDA